MKLWIFHFDRRPMALWANAVLMVAENWVRLADRMSDMVGWRYRFEDKHCHCRNCEKRRAEGLQK